MRTPCVLSRAPLRTFLVFVLAAILAWTARSIAVAQSEAASGVWVLIGGAYVDGIEGLGFETVMGGHHHRTFFGARLLYAEEFCVFGCSNPGRVLALGPVFGFRDGSRYLQAQLNAGVSFNSLRWSDSNDDESQAAVGVPVEAALIFTPSRSFGIGAAGFRDFNAKHAYSGIIVFIVFGD